MTDLTVVPLHELPSAVDVVAAWVDREWGRFSGRTLDETRARFANEPASPGLPASLVAITSGVPVGLATLRVRDSVDWDPGATPWVCNVVVSEAARGNGVAGRLCRGLEVLARERGYSRLHLATLHPGPSLYDRLGYERYKVVESKGDPFFLMRRDL